jgi:hypothetical protein
MFHRRNARNGAQTIMAVSDRLPTPDPTILTTQALSRAVSAERDYVNGRVSAVEERLHAIDVATRLLNETVNRTPTDITKEVTHLRELMQVELRSVSNQFAERDTRSERESRDNKLAVDAAFAAQEKQSRAQNESNGEAIRKSELATSDTIKTNQELAMTKIEGIDKLLNETRLIVTGLISSRQGGQETKAGIYALAGFVAVLISIFGTLAATGVFAR